VKNRHQTMNEVQALEKEIEKYGQGIK
jgi:hypothetical protein